MTMLPDVDETGYDDWQNQLFTEDTARKIQGIGLQHWANDRMADLARLGAWAGMPPPEAPTAPPPEPAPAAPPLPTPEAQTPELPVAPGPPTSAPEQPLAPGPAASAPEPTLAPPPAAAPSAVAPPSSDWQNQVFGQALGAVSRAGGDVQAFADRFGQGLSSAQDAQSAFGQALGAASAAGADVQAFADAFQPPERPAPPATRVAGGSPVPGGPLQDYARQAAQRAGIDPDVFTRQIQQESGFNPNAGSPAGARGIAQIVPKFHPGVDPSDPYASLDYAANLMKSNLSKYGGDYAKALAAYNAGGGAVDKYGGVPPFEETQRYVNTILGGQQPGPRPTTTAEQLLGQTGGWAQQAAASRDISQFGDPQLTNDEAYAACGPAAAVRFAQKFGRNPSLREAINLAASVGWTTGQGMAGLGSEQALMTKLGVPTKLVNGPDWGTFANEAKTGNPVTISTQGHYFTADGWDPTTNRFHVGRSGLDLKGGAEWMTPEQMTALMGPVQGGLLADNPQVPAPSVADQETNPLDWLDRAKKSMADSLGATGNVLQQGIIEPLRGAFSLESTPDPHDVALARLDASVTQAANPPSLLESGGRRLQSDIGQALAGARDVLGVDERQRQIEQGQQYLRDQRTEAAPSGPLGELAFDVGRGAELGAAESRVETAADVRAGEQLAGTVIDQAKAQGWQPTPDEERVARTVLSQVTPMNVLLSVAGGGTAGGIVSGTGRAIARSAAESALGLGLNIAGTTVASEVAQNAGLPAPVQFGAGLVGGALAQMTGHGAIAGAGRAAEYLASPEGQAALRTRQRAQFSLDPDAARAAEEARAAGPATGGSVLQRAYDGLKAYPDEVAGPVREWAQSMNAPQSTIGSTLLRWMEENPPSSVERSVSTPSTGEISPAAARATGRQAVRDLNTAVGGRGPGIPGGAQPGQMFLEGGLPVGGPRPGGTEAVGPAGAQPGQMFLEGGLPMGGPRPGGTEAIPGGAMTGQVPMFGGEYQPPITERPVGQEAPPIQTTVAWLREQGLVSPEYRYDPADEPKLQLMAEIEHARQARGEASGATAGRSPEDMAAAAAGDPEAAQALSRSITWDDLAEVRRLVAPDQPLPGMPVGDPAKASVPDRIQGYMSSNMLLGPHSWLTNATTQSEEVLRPIAIRALAGYPGEAWTGLRMLAAGTNDAVEGGLHVLATGKGADPVETLTHAPIGPEAFGVRINAGMDEMYRNWGRAQGMAMEAARVVAENPDLSKAEALRQNATRINAAGQKAGATSVFADGPSEGLGAQASGLRTRLINDPDPKKQAMGWALYAAMPFSRIPERIWTTGIRRSGGVNEVLGTAKVINAARKGDWRGVRLAAAETTLDSAINLAILNQAINGNITAADDPEHPWSIRLPAGQWLDYRTLGPVATRMGAMASVVEANREQSNKLKPNALVDVMDKVGSMTMNQWFLGPTVGVLDLIRNGNLSGAATKFLVQQGDRLTPASAFANFIEKSTDPVLRDPSKELPQALWERQQSRIPGLAQMLPPKISTTTGEPEPNPQQNPLQVFAGLEGEPDDPVRHVLADLKLGGYSLVPPPSDTSSLTIAGSEVPLTPDERRAYMAARGKFVRDQAAFMDTQDYRDMDEPSRARYWQRVLDASSGAARAQLIEDWGGTDSQAFQDRIAAGHRVVGKLSPLTPEPATPTPVSRRRQ